MYSSHRQPKKSNRYRWLIFTPAALLALTTPANAEPQPGLNAIGYTYQPTSIPTRDDTLYPVCHSETENNINRNFNGEPFGPCPYDFFMVHYSGYITLPEHDTISFMVAADDGGTVNIAGTEFGTWNLKGCRWSQQVTLTLQAGSYPLDGWFFEWGGGTCYMLAWNIDNTGWAIVPDSAFTRTELTVPTTTVPTTTTIEPTTTTVEVTTTTVEETTTTTEQTTTTTTTTTTVYVPPATTTTEATTTTTVPETTTTLPPTTTIPPSTTVEPSTTTTHSSTTTVRTTVPPTTSVPETTTTPPSTTTTIPPTTTIPETTPPPQVTLNSDTDSSQIAQLLVSLEPDQAAEVFASIEVEELDEEQVAALVAAVQNAPTEVREAFEEQVDIYKSGLDTYVPVGSKIPVGERRALIAIGAAIAAAGATRIRR